MSRKSRRSSISGAPVTLATGTTSGSWIALASIPARAVEADPAAQTVRSILRNHSYQREMPGSPTDGWHFTLSLGRFGELLIYVLVATTLALVALWLWREFGRRAWGHGLAHSAGPDPWERPALSASIRLADIEALAEQERYDEAVHLLLLAAIGELSKHPGAGAGQSSTSRELLRLLPLGPNRRKAFAELVRQVELSFFGGRPVGAEHYEACRRSFDALLAGAEA